MRRIRMAWVILLLSAFVCAASHFAVLHTANCIHAQLTQLRAAAADGNYENAALQAKKLAAYYNNRQHLLEIFIRRDTVAAVSVSLNGLAAYAEEDTLYDLFSEVDKADAQVSAMEHLFFSIF